MKRLMSVVFILSTGMFVSSGWALELSFADQRWNGVKVPSGEQCQKFGGINPSTPHLRVTGIPTGADALVLAYSDRSYKKMDNGGHGKMRYRLMGQVTAVEVPSVAGHSFDLPKGFLSLEAHRSPKWDRAGAYMPPCSGGKGNAYYVTIQALDGKRVLAESVLEMGRY